MDRASLLRLPPRSHRQLAAWQRAIELCVACHQLADRLPDAQRAGLGEQIRRAAGAVPANVAEGYGRLHRGDYVHHLSIARGALKELETHLVVAHRLRHLDAAEAAALDRQCAAVGRLLSQLIRSLCDLPTPRRAG